MNIVDPESIKLEEPQAASAASPSKRGSKKQKNIENNNAGSKSPLPKAGARPSAPSTSPEKNAVEEVYIGTPHLSSKIGNIAGGINTSNILFSIQCQENKIQNNDELSLNLLFLIDFNFRFRDVCIQYSSWRRFAFGRQC